MCLFVYLSTGFGKSLCYALLPLVFDYLRGSAGHSIFVCTFLQCSGSYSTRTLVCSPASGIFSLEQPDNSDASSNKVE